MNIKARAKLLTMILGSSLLAAALALTQYKYSTPVAPGVAVPDKIETSLGTLTMNYGYPSADTVEKIYDNLDRSRALQAYLMAIPIVNQAGMRDSIRKNGPDNQTDVIWEELVDARTVELTANDNTGARPRQPRIFRRSGAFPDGPIRSGSGPSVKVFQWAPDVGVMGDIVHSSDRSRRTRLHVLALIERLV